MPLSELKDGARGVDVRVAQQLLNDSTHSRPGLSRDGVYGPLTHGAVVAFQRAHSLDADGVVGPLTWTALKALPSQSSPAPAAPSAARGSRPPATAAAPAPRVALAVSTAPTAALPPLLQALDPAGEPAWLKVALAEYGIHERTVLGSRRIIQYHQATKLHATSDQVAWCSSFVNWCLEQVGVVGSRSAAAASWSGWGVGLATPKLGCIVQLHHAVKGYTSATGTASGNHVAFFIKQDAAHISLLGGNQSDSVRLSQFPLTKWSVRAYRWPGGGQ